MNSYVVELTATTSKSLIVSKLGSLNIPIVLDHSPLIVIGSVKFKVKPGYSESRVFLIIVADTLLLCLHVSALLVAPPLQDQPSSTKHWELHPSPLSVFPSSHP